MYIVELADAFLLQLTWAEWTLERMRGTNARKIGLKDARLFFKREPVCNNDHSDEAASDWIFGRSRSKMSIKPLPVFRVRFIERKTLISNREKIEIYYINRNVFSIGNQCFAFDEPNSGWRRCSISQSWTAIQDEFTLETRFLYKPQIY